MPDGDQTPQAPSTIVAAATVVVLRPSPANDGVQALMLHKNSGHAFGGMWVFPGGRVDPDDGSDGDNDLERARHAAVREAAEEAGLLVAAEDLVPFAHWTPPPESPRRFATWFFVTESPDVRDVVVDGGEIVDHAWIAPAEALERHASREIDLATPTWMTLHGLQGWSEPREILEVARRDDISYYATHISVVEDMLIAMWDGDAGYEARDPAVPGARNRLLMPKGDRWTLQRTAS